MVMNQIPYLACTDILRANTGRATPARVATIKVSHLEYRASSTPPIGRAFSYSLARATRVAVLPATAVFVLMHSAILVGCF